METSCPIEWIMDSPLGLEEESLSEDGDIILSLKVLQGLSCGLWSVKRVFY